MKLQNSVSTAVVLCAGRGKRLSPHTDSTPKPLLQVNNKPTLDFILASLQYAGIKRIILVTHYLSEQLNDYANTQSYFPQSATLCVRQEQLAGTADATVAALVARPDWFDSPFLLTASDYLVPLPFYKSLLDAYQQSRKVVGVSLKRMDEAELAMRSSVRFDDSGDVLEIVEKPAAGMAPSSFSANLIYVLPADIVNDIHQVTPSPRGEKEIQSAVNSYLQANGAAFSLEQVAPSEWEPGLQ